MKIKRVDNKPMVIHTKQKAKLHVRALKKATIKGNKTYTILRGPKIKSDAGVAVKKKNSSIKVAGAVGTQAALSHMEGGDEIRDAAGEENDNTVKNQSDEEILTLLTCANRGTKRFVCCCVPAVKEGEADED